MQFQTMIGLLQRVSSASVSVDGVLVSAIERGILVLVAVEQGDTDTQAVRLAERLTGYRVFPDADGKLNRSVRDIDGGILLVPQFTLAADTNKGTRASFTSAAAPEEGRRLFDYLYQRISASQRTVQRGVFGADMKVALINDGPVTFWLRVAPDKQRVN
jgi:D-tyrosyl-tRNA(Tyr) deacylase